MEELIPYLFWLILFVLLVIVILWGISIYFMTKEKMSVRDWARRAMGLPQGTVRALIAFILLFLLVVGVVTGDEFPELPDWLVGLLGAVVGFYFGAALNTKPPEEEIKKPTESEKPKP